MNSTKSSNNFSFWRLFLHIIINEDVTVPNLYYFVEALAQLQIISNLILFMFHFSNLKPEEHLSEEIVKFFQVISFSQDSIRSSFYDSARDLLFLFSIFYLLLIYGVIIYYATFFYLTGKLSGGLGKLVRVALNLHMKFLFMVTSGVFFSYYKESSGYILEISDNAKPVILVLFLLNFMPAVLFSFFGFQPIQKNFILSHRPNCIAFAEVFFKFICIIFIEVYSSWDSARIFFYIMALILLTWRMSIILRSNPYHIYQGYRVMLGAIALQFSLILLTLTFISDPYQTSYDPLLIVFTTAPVLTQFILVTTKPNLEKLLFSKAKNTNQANLIISLLIHIFKHTGFQNTSQSEEQFKEEEMTFMGILKIHSTRCVDNNCYCNYFSNFTKGPYQNVKFSSDVDKKLQDFKFNYLKETYQEFISREIKADIWMVIDFINLVMTFRPDAFPIALSMVHQLKTNNLGTFQLHFVNLMIENVTESVNSNINLRNEQVDANNFFEFRIEVQSFKQEVAITTAKSISFWKVYRENSPVFKYIIEISNEIQRDFRKISEHWTCLKKTYSSLLMKEYRMYSTFLATVEHSPKQSRDLLFEFNNFISHRINTNSIMLDKITKDTIRDEKNIIISISMNKLKLGNVLQVTPNIEARFEWRPHELINNNMNTLLPTFVREYHNKKLSAHLVSGTGKILLSNQLVFVQAKNGFLVPCYVYVAPQPNIEKEFTYIAIIRPIKKKYEYIVVNDTMDIIGWTSEFGRDFTFSTFSSKTNLKETFSTRANLNCYSFETLDIDTLRERTGGKHNYDVAENKYILNLKYGCCYICELDVGNFLEMPNTKIFKVEKLPRDYEPASNLKVKDELSLSIIKQEESINCLENILVQVGVTSDNDNDPEKSHNFEPDTNMDVTRQTIKPLVNNFLDTGAKYLDYKIQIVKGKSENPSNGPDSQRNASESNFEESSQPTKELEDVDQFYEQSYKASSIASKKSSHWREMHEIDISIREKPKAQRLQILSNIFVLYNLIIMIGTIAIDASASSLVNLNGDIAGIMRDSTLRLYYFLELHRRTRMIFLIAQNNIPNNFSTSYTTISYYNLTQLSFMGDLQLSFSTLNHDISENIYILDKSLINQIYEPVELTSRRPTEPDLFVPVSGAVYEFIQMIVSLRKSNQIRTTNTAANYILKNTLNDILIRSEEAPGILFAAVKQSDENINNILIAIIICFVVIMLVMIGLFSVTEYHYSKAKTRYVQTIMKVDDKDLEFHVSRLEEFLHSLAIKIDKVKFAQFSSGMLNQASGNNIADKKHRRNMKKVNMDGIHTNALYRLVKFFLLGIICLGPIFALYAFFGQYKDNVNHLVATLIKNEDLLSKYVLNFVSIYEYVSLNSTSTVRNLPIQDELENDMNFIKDNFGFYEDIDTRDDDNNARVRSLASGNLCVLLNETIDDYSDCIAVAEGSVTKGILGMTSYFTRVLNRMKLEFDNSDRDNTTIKSLFNLAQLRDAELLFDIAFRIPFLEIDTILIDSIEKRTLIFQTQAIWVNVLSIVFGLFLGYLGYKIYYVEGIEERRRFRMVLKIFPARLVKTQGHIRNYMNSDYGNMFDL